jgi:hypothetical protein
MGATFAVGDALCQNGIDATTGQPVVKDPATVVDNDPSFLGVVITDCTNATNDVKLKNSGLVTIAVYGAVAVGDSLGLAAGQKYCIAGNTGVGIAKSTNVSGAGFVRAMLGVGVGTDRYPLGARVTALNGFNYDVIEVDGGGSDIAGYTHTAVPNIGDATLSVSGKYPLFRDPSGDFFFDETD